MIRVTAEDVYLLRPSETPAQSFIELAHLLIEQSLATAGYSEPLLTEIERWWAAHLMEAADPRAIDRRLGDTQVKYGTAPDGTGLAATRYGQQVLALDTGGYLLATTEALKPASFYVD